MAGRPKMQSDLGRLAAEPGLGEQVMELLEEGKLLSRVCYATGLGKGALLHWLQETPERAAAFAQARASAAHRMVEEAIEIADEADEENGVAIQKAKLRTQVRHWTAERWNRKDYGQAKAEVNVSISGLHFDALRRLPAADVVDVVPVLLPAAPPTAEELADL